MALWLLSESRRGIGCQLDLTFLKVLYNKFDICLTVHHGNKLYKHQLDAKITVY
jgi:hypothetical protein